MKSLGKTIALVAVTSALVAADIYLWIPSPHPRPPAEASSDRPTKPDLHKPDHAGSDSLPAIPTPSRQIRIAHDMAHRDDSPSHHALEIRARFLRLAGRDKYLALDSALRLKGADRNLALATLVAAWKEDPQKGSKELAQIVELFASFAHGQGPSGGDFKDLQQLVQFPSLEGNFSFLVMRMANRLLTADTRANILSLAAFAYAKIDPAAALAFGSSISGPAFGSFVEMFSKGWASQDPQAAAQWAASIEDPVLRQRSFITAVTAFSRSNPSKAAEWLQTLPPGESRQIALQELGMTWARQDTLAALAWAEKLPDASERQQGKASIQAVAPVGVGIELSRTKDSGYPVAMDLVPSGPAAITGSIRRGDQIVAVTSADKQWLDTSGMTQEEVISHIRGTAGQPVQLRLLPMGTSDLSLARTVTIVRQQLLFKNAPPNS